uniref:MGMT family protein n=1 Tax=Candidatus Methanomethylicus mesodigestus TaxID=1867258 RepID=A0A7C3F0J9_9CREN
MKRKSWIEKFDDDKDLPKVVNIEGKMTRKWGEGTMVIPSPREVYEIMSRVPEGSVTTINEIRSYLSKKHKADLCCPITTGIFAWVSANASEELKSRCEGGIPYWRTLRSDGLINEKYPGGAERQKALLEKEGHKIIKRGKRYFVDGFEGRLFSSF